MELKWVSFVLFRPCGAEKFDLMYFPGLPPGLTLQAFSPKTTGRYSCTAMIAPNGTLFAELDALLPSVLDKAFPVEHDNA